MTAALAAPSPLRDEHIELLPVDDSVPTLLVAASHDEEITRWTGVPAGMTMLDAGLVSAGWASNPKVVRLQVRDAQGSPLGMVTVWINNAGEAEVGYWLLESGRGRGIARRAVRMLCEWAFATCELERLQLTTMPGNARSERVATACSFAPAGTVDRDIKGVMQAVQLWVRQRDGTPGAADQRAAIGT
jgi:RimJ/RimL family protein N-acetyltransferase